VLPYSPEPGLAGSPSLSLEDTSPPCSVRAPSPNSGRFATAQEAGLSRHQTVTALRVARIPADEFEQAVESDDPPTVTEPTLMAPVKVEPGTSKCAVIRQPSTLRSECARPLDVAQRMRETLGQHLHPGLGHVVGARRAQSPPAWRSSDRHPKGGRLQIGMADIKSESVADFIPELLADLLRNQQVKYLFFSKCP
jgi:hypothetical protein